MIEEDEGNSQAVESHRIVIPNEIVTPRSSLRKQRLERRCKLCCACTSVLIFIIGMILMILFLTVLKVKKPKIKLRNVTIKGLEGVNPLNLLPSTNLTIIADVSVKNPNIASLKFKNGTTEIYYEKVQVADAQIPAGNAKAKKTIHINVTADFMLKRILSVPGLVGDLTAGSMPLDMKTSIKGKVDIIGIVKKAVGVKMDCSLIFVITNQTVQGQKCNTSVDL